jgi:GNAT superfamily N-acetyltransferase
MPKSQRKKIYRKSNKSLKLKNMKQLRKSKLSKKKTKGGMGCGCQGNNMNNNLDRPISNSIKNRISKGLITNPEQVNSMLKKRYQQNNNLNNSNPTIEEINLNRQNHQELNNYNELEYINYNQNNNENNNNENNNENLVIGENNTNKYMVMHPLNQFIITKKDDNYILCVNKDNVDKIEYDNLYHNAFFMKIVDILNESFMREREYHISKGNYPTGYKHDIGSIKSNVHNPRFETLILVSSQMEPISLLYVEKNEDDYDKIWTVCTDSKFRGQGMTSKLLNYMITRQLNKKRNKMLLEVYNDHIISRKEEENDVVQKQIMAVFGSKGFEHTPLEYLEKNENHTFNNLLSNTGETKVMIFNPKKWCQDNGDEQRNLNSSARTTCGC